VDGSGAKLILANSSGADASGNFTLYQDARALHRRSAAQVRLVQSAQLLGLHYI